MSRYIDMITKANKTLTTKVDILSSENNRLRAENRDLKNKIGELHIQQQDLMSKQCKNNNMCDNFNENLERYFSLVDLINRYSM